MKFRQLTYRNFLNTGIKLDFIHDRNENGTGKIIVLEAILIKLRNYLNEIECKGRVDKYYDRIL